MRKRLEWQLRLRSRAGVSFALSGLNSASGFPTAYAVVFILAPLRGCVLEPRILARCAAEMLEPRILGPLRGCEPWRWGAPLGFDLNDDAFFPTLHSLRPEIEPVFPLVTMLILHLSGSRGICWPRQSIRGKRCLQDYFNQKGCEEAYSRGSALQCSVARFAVLRCMVLFRASSIRGQKRGARRVTSVI